MLKAKSASCQQIHSGSRWSILMWITPSAISATKPQACCHMLAGTQKPLPVQSVLFYCSDRSDSRCYMTRSQCHNPAVRAQGPPTNKSPGLWTQRAGILDILPFVTKIDHPTLLLTFVFGCCFQPYTFPFTTTLVFLILQYTIQQPVFILTWYMKYWKLIILVPSEELSVQNLRTWNWTDL